MRRWLAMKYLLLLTNPVDEIAHWETLSAEETGRLREVEIPQWNELFAHMAENGVQSSGLELELPSKAKTVRVRNGDTLVTDGPFAETKEQIGGFFVVDVPDLDAAMELARRIPIVNRGSVEIRPLVE